MDTQELLLISQTLINLSDVLDSRDSEAVRHSALALLWRIDDKLGVEVTDAEDESDESAERGWRALVGD